MIIIIITTKTTTTIINRADSSTVRGCTFLLEFDAATNRGIPSLGAIQATSGKGNKQPVRRIQKNGHKKKIG